MIFVLVHLLKYFMFDNSNVSIRTINRRLLGDVTV